MRSSQLIVLAAALGLGLVVAGCSKKKETVNASNPGAEPANPAAAAVPPEEDTPQVRDVQASVDAYEKIYKRKLGSLEQMVKEGFLVSLPPAPAGKRFTLDPATQRVRVVPK